MLHSNSLIHHKMLLLYVVIFNNFCVTGTQIIPSSLFLNHRKFKDKTSGHYLNLIEIGIMIEIIIEKSFQIIPTNFHKLSPTYT